MSKNSAIKWSECCLDPDTDLRVTLFGRTRVQATWTIAERRLEEHLMYFVMSGGYVGRAGRSRLRQGPGSLLWVPPGVEHAFSLAPGQALPTLYHLRFRVMDGGVSTTPHRSPLVLRKADALARPFTELYEEHASGWPDRALRFRARLGLLVSSIEHIGRSASTRPTLSTAQRRRLFAFIDEHSDTRLTAGELAEHLGLSLDYFTRLFRRSFGRPPRDWLLRRRIHEAGRRLEQPELSVTDVAHSLGYPDVYLFSRQFKAVTGTSPRRYRALFAGRES